MEDIPPLCDRTPHHGTHEHGWKNKRTQRLTGRPTGASTSRSSARSTRSGPTPRSSRSRALTTPRPPPSTTASALPTSTVARLRSAAPRSVSSGARSPGLTVCLYNYDLGQDRIADGLQATLVLFALSSRRTSPPSLSAPWSASCSTPARYKCGYSAYRDLTMMDVRV